MKVPYTWLREYCDPGWSPGEAAERLAMTGTEVERVGHIGAPSADGFVVGKVLGVEPHPDADRLRVCTVDAGGEPRTIVCGAPNVAGGQTVPVALPGATMPGGGTLGAAKLRGVRSEGMILSEIELEIGDDADGIAVLEDGVAPGTPLSEVLSVSEPVLELEVTPNRVDCFGVYGVARELHAISGVPLAEEPWARDAEAEGEGEVGDHARLRVEDPDLCPRFTARVFTDVRIAPSPLWLKARLVAGGQRPINNVVDITNYVMLLTAQPLHAFDLDRVAGGELAVRRARSGEKLTTLDGIDRELDTETMVVCDDEGPSAIAGIMGGERSEVSPQTVRLLLEVATWDGVNILRSSSRLGLRSEASTRFEKQLHPELCMRAQAIASRLLVELAGARLVPGTLDVRQGTSQPRRLTLRSSRVEGLLGQRIDPADSAAYLERLGFGVEIAGNDLEVEVSPDRHFDVTREADLIEEVARVHGLDKLPVTLPATRNRLGGLSRDQRLRRRAEDVMRDLGFDEVVGWSFAAADLADRLRLPPDDRRRAAVALRNPLSDEHSTMRTTLLGGLLDAARHNVARGVETARLFESGRVYMRSDGLEAAATGPLAGEFAGARRPPAAERHRLACIATGEPAQSWRGTATPGADVFAVKGTLAALCEHLGLDWDVEPAAEPFLHPGRSGAIHVAGRPAGWIGELHPRVASDWDLGGVAGFELDLAATIAESRAGTELYEDVTTHPPVHEDIAVVVDEELPAAVVRSVVLDAGGDLLRSAELFDLYRGEQLEPGKKSLALRLEFGAPDRTLTDDEVASRRARITEALARVGGSLRD